MDCFYDYPEKQLNQGAGQAPAKPLDFGMLVIHPDECIHCGACEPECPVEAIFEEDDVPGKWASYIELNAKVSRGYTQEELDKYRVTSKS